MEWKRLFIFGAVPLAVLAVAGVVVMIYWFGRAMYEPGHLSALGAALEPPAPRQSAPDVWQVTPAVALHHFAVGQGEDVLIVHGGPGLPTVEAWRGARALADRFRFHFYDQRGCGRSTRPVTKLESGGNLYEGMKMVERELGLGAQIADVERIRRLLGQDRLTLVGHSFGGLIAALYAAEFPGHVKALVLVAPANLVAMPLAGDDLFTTVGKRLPAEMADPYSAYLRAYFDFKTLFTKDDAELAGFFGTFAKYYAAAAGDPAVPPRLDPRTRGGGFMPLGVYLSLGKRHSWGAALSRVTAPVLVVHGTRDLIPAADAQAFAGYFPHASLVEIEGAGHFPFIDKPQEFAAAVGGFL